MKGGLANIYRGARQASNIKYHVSNPTLFPKNCRAWTPGRPANLEPAPQRPKAPIVAWRLEGQTDLFGLLSMYAATRTPQGGSLVAREDELVVVVPAVLLEVDAGLELGDVAPGRAGAAAREQLEALLLQHVERLLDRAVLEEEARRVAL